MARPAVPELNLNGAETASVCSDLDSGIGSCSPTSTGPACVPEHRSVQTFRSTEDYLYAMKEDLAEWLNCLYDQDMDVDNFFDKLENGVLLCDHANHVQMLADEYRDEDVTNHSSPKIPEKAPVYRKNVKKGTFQARDNIANFISWCKQLGIPDVILFETEDLVMRKNEKSVVLAILEIARKGAKFGMLVPCLIQLEQEIDAEIKGSPPPVKKVEPKMPMVQTITCDMRSLDEMVRDLVSQCTCLPSQFPLIRLAEGKYQVGENKTLIFVRVLRNHVMVRVGGGWDTLENYLNKHDPCRCQKTVTRKTSATRPRVVTKDPKANVQEQSKSHTPINSTPNTPQQVRRTVTEAQTVPTRRISTPERPRPSTATPQTSTSARRRLSLDSGPENSTSTRSSTTPDRSRIPRSPSTEMTNPADRSASKDRTSQLQRSSSKDRLNPKQAWTSSPSPKQRSPVSPERSLARSLAGSLSDIRQQSDMLMQQLQEDFSDDSSLCSDVSSISRHSDKQQMSKSFDFSKLREARRASAPPKESTPPSRSVVRRSQTPQQTPQREQLIRRSITPQPQPSSRVKSTPTTPVARRREVPRNTQTPDKTVQSKAKPQAAMTSTLKERLNKYKQETTHQQRAQQQQQQKTSRSRRDSDKPVIRRDSNPKRSQSCQPGLAGARFKSTSLSALDTVELNLDEIEDVGGNEELYMEMEKMFQEFKQKEREKDEKDNTRASIEAELDRRLNVQKPDKKASIREHFNQKGKVSGSKTAPNTPGIQRRSASAAPSWRENSDQIIRRTSTPKRSKTPDPQLDLVDFVDPQQNQIRKCYSKLSELLDDAASTKPRRDDDVSRPKTRIPAPASVKSNFRRTSSLTSLASSTDESESSDLSKSVDNEIKAINRSALSPRTRRMSVPAEPNRMMAPLITNRCTIIKDVPRAMSPVKALRDPPRAASPIKAFRRQESQ